MFIKRMVCLIIALSIIIQPVTTSSANVTTEVATNSEANIKTTLDTNTLQQATHSDISVKTETEYMSEINNSYKVDFSIDSQWQGAFNGRITITNTGLSPIENWCLSFKMNNEITNIWNASIFKHETEGYIIKNLGWNQDIPVGGTVSFGFSATYKGNVDTPNSYKMPLMKEVVKAEKYSVKFILNSDWNSGYSATVNLTNLSDKAIEDWTIEFDFPYNISSIWNAQIVSHQSSHYIIKNPDYNQNIGVNQTISFGFTGSPGKVSDYPTNYKLTQITIDNDDSEPDNPEEADTSAEDLKQYLTEMGYASAAQADYEDLELGYADNNSAYAVTNNIDLITSGTYSSNIVWDSSDESVISKNGVITRPNGESKIITLTATISDGIETKTKEFTVKVIKKHVAANVPMTSVKEFKELNNGTFPVMYTGDGGKTVNYIDGSFTSYKVESMEDAVDSVNSVAKLLGVDYSTDSFTAAMMDADKEDVVFRLQQMYKGIPVYAKELLIATDLQGNTTLLDSSFQSGINLDITPSITKEDAINIALGLHTDVSQVSECNLNIVEDSGQYKLAWMISLGLDSEDYDGNGYSVTIDAKTGEVITDNSDEMDASPALLKGKDVDGNMVEGVIGGTKYSGIIDRVLLGHGKYEMYDKRYNLVIYDAKNESAYSKSIVKSDTATIENPIAISAAKNFISALEYYYINLDRNSIDGKGKKIKVCVNAEGYNKATKEYVKDWKNACWSSSVKAFKIGSGRDNLFAAGFDTIAHEFTHGVMYYKVHLDDSIYSGAINEAYADIMGCMIEKSKLFYNTAYTNDMWAFGERYAENPYGDRNLRDPSLTECPKKYGEDDNWIVYDPENDNSSLFEHNNSTIISHAAYLMYDAIGGANNLSELWYQSMKYLKESNKDFSNVRRAVVKAAEVLNYTDEQMQAIQNAFFACGIMYESTGGLYAEGSATDLLENATTVDSYSVFGSVYKLEAENDELEISNAAVALSDSNGSVLKQTTTDENGDYCFTDVYSGNYTLTVSANGYESKTVNIEVVDSNQNRDINLNLLNSDLLLTYNTSFRNLQAFYSITAKEYIIDWGDGTVTTNELVHAYDTAGVHTIKVQFKDLENICFFKTPLIRVEGCLKGLSKNFVSAFAMFERTSISSVPEGFFDNCVNVKSFGSCFSMCEALTSIPDGLFDQCTNATDFNGCFTMCEALISIPDGLFDKCTKATDFKACFSSCRLLGSIPNKLFANCPNINDISFVFSYCRSLRAIPEGLFDNCFDVTDFSYCFSDCESLTSIPNGLFKNSPKVTTFSHCFTGCKLLSSIPKGLFDNGTNVTDFGCCFINCESLASIPEGLFDNCPNVTSFILCFCSCYMLTSIPDGLFMYCSKVEDFSGCFTYCRTLTFIPEGIFDNCPDALKYSYCFFDCPALLGNAPAIWERTNSENCKSCFYNCKKLTNYDEIPNSCTEYDDLLISY